MKDKILEYLNQSEDMIKKTWNELHAIPEVGFKEERTSAYLAERLRKAGYQVKTGIGGTGIIGTLDSGKPGPTVGLRADMDALCHEVKGEKVTIHSCGHDANSTMGLAAAEAIAACGGPKRGVFKMVFQPAEETLEGANAMIKSGEMEGFDYLVGVHLRPMEELPFGKITPALRHGASGIMLVKFKGVQAHGARPHQGVNTVEAAALAILAVSQIKVDPRVPHSVKPTMIKGGGTAFNIIPDSVDMALDLRAQTNVVMEQLKKKVGDALRGAASANGATVEINWKGGVPAAEDDPEVVALAEDAIRTVLGEDGLAAPVVTSGGEDFHNFVQVYKGLKTTIVGIGADVVPGLHNPEMKFNIDAVPAGAKVLALIAASLIS